MVDARDPNSSRNFEVEEIIEEHGKRVVVVLNYTQYVPKDVVEGWKRYFNERGRHCVELVQGEMSWLQDKMKIGIFGNPKSGKSFVLKSMSSFGNAEMDSSLFSVPLSNISLSSILPGCHKLMGIPFKSYIDLVLEKVNKIDVSLHYGVPEFNDANELFGYICDKHQIRDYNKGIDSVDATKKFLLEFFEHKILFWRKVDDDENCLSFRFPQQHQQIKFLTISLEDQLEHRDRFVWVMIDLLHFVLLEVFIINFL